MSKEKRRGIGGERRMGWRRAGGGDEKVRRSKRVNKRSELFRSKEVPDLVSRIQDQGGEESSGRETQRQSDR